jgi:hypothetical protein
MKCSDVILTYCHSLRLEATPLATGSEKRKLLFEFLETHPGSSLVYVTQQKVRCLIHACSNIELTILVAS